MHLCAPKYNFNKIVKKIRMTLGAPARVIPPPLSTALNRQNVFQRLIKTAKIEQPTWRKIGKSATVCVTFKTPEI